MKVITPILVIATLVLSLVQSSLAQEIRSCGKDSHMQELLNDPEYVRERLIRLRQFENYQLTSTQRALCASPVVLPMAVHYQGVSNPDQACLIALAQSQIQILNDDYQGTNADITNWTNNAASSFPGASNGETCIEFCLATQNHPAGYGLSNGDVAVTINQFSGDFRADWSGYINIFVRNIGFLGYSPFPGSGNGDGVTIDNNAFGATGSGCAGVNPSAPYNLGRTLTHELGHYLLLDHIWGGGCGNDDGIADTPSQQSSYGGCPNIGASSCGSTDMHMNYMDYVNDICMYMFSEDQSTVMENYVASNMQNLVNNATVVCQPPTPTCPINASLTGNASGIVDNEVNNWIQSDQTIMSGASIDYDASNYILLKNNFCVDANANFEAFIDGCDGGGGGINLQSNSDKIE